MSTTTPPTTYTPSFVKYSDLIAAGLLEAFHQYGLKDRKMNWKNALETGLYKSGGRLLNEKVTTPVPMLILSEDDMYAAVIAGIDSAVRKNASASKAAMDGLYVGLAGYTANMLMSALKYTDSYLI